MAWNQLAALADRRYVDDQRPFLPVANGTHFNGNGGSTANGLLQLRCRQTRKLLRVIASGATKLRVEWANIWTSNTPQAADASCEMAGPNSVTVRMSIEYPAGNPRLTAASAAWSSATAYVVRDQVNHLGSTWVAVAASTNSAPAAANANWRLVRRYPVRWDGDDGNGTKVFAAGDYRASLSIDLLDPMVPGDLIAVLGAFDTGNTTNRVPTAGANGACNTFPFVDWVIDAAGGMPAVGAALPDIGVTTQVNASTTAANSTDSTAWTRIPYATAITGNVPSRQCVALFGDSLIQGTGGDIRDGEPAGMFVRALDGMNWWRIAQGGNQAGCYSLNNAPWQMSCVARCSSVLTDLGMNDIQAGGTAAVVKASMTRVWQALAARGVPVYSGLLTPISASTDAWATTVNQTRWAGGTSPATQFPTDDATFLTSVYGLTQLWLGQDGAEITVDGVTQRAGQANHPLRQILDWRSLMADSQTSWKWNAGYTTDGAHPNGAAVTVQAAYLAPQLDGLVMGRGSLAQPIPAFNPAGEAPVQPFGRSEVFVRSATPITGSIMTSLGVASGRLYYGCRVWSGITSTRVWTILAGLDAAKMKVVASGSTAFTADTVGAFGFAAPLWIPAGQLVALVLATPATNAWGGLLAYNALVHKTGLNFLLAGTSADTVSLAGTVSLYTGVKFTAHAFRVWGELF